MCRFKNLTAVIMFFLILLIPLRGFSREEEEVLSFTLSESIETALENSLELVKADQDILASDAGISQAETGKYPSFFANAYYSRIYPVAKIAFGSEEIGIMKPDQAQLTFTFNYTLYDGSYTSNLVDQTTLVRDSLIFDRERVRQDVIFNVIEAYYNVLKAEALLRVAEENLETAQEEEKRAEAFYREGLVPRADVLNGEAHVANAELSLIKAKKYIESTKSVLKDAMYFPLNSSVEVSSDLIFEPLPVDLEYVTELACKNRSEIKGMEILVLAAGAAIEVAKSQGRPYMYFNFDYIPVTSTTFNESNSLTATLGVSIPIFDRGITKYRVEEAEINLKKSEVSLEQVKKKISLQVKETYLSVIEAEEEVKKVEETLEFTRENYRLSSLRYKEGIAPFIEVTDSRALLTASEVEKVQASYNYFLSVARLIRAAGLLPEDGKLNNIILIDNSNREEEGGLNFGPDAKNEL